MYSYTIHRNGQNEGPYSAEQLQAGLDQGTVSPTDLVWRAGLAEWAPLAQQLAADSGAAPAAPARPAQPARPAGPQQARPAARTAPRKKPFNWVGLSIFATLFSVLSCWLVPFGIVAIVFAFKANSKESAGDYAGAAKSRGLAKGFTLGTYALTLLSLAAFFTVAAPFARQALNPFQEKMMLAEAQQISAAAYQVMNDDLTTVAELGKIRAITPALGVSQIIVVDGEAVPYLTGNEKLRLKKGGKFSLRNENYKRTISFTPGIKEQSGPETDIEFFVDNGLPVSK